MNKTMKYFLFIMPLCALISCGESIETSAEKGCNLVSYYQYYQEDPENIENVKFSQNDLKKSMESGGFTIDQVQKAMINCEADPNLLKIAYELSFENENYNNTETSIEEVSEDSLDDVPESKSGQFSANASLTIAKGETSQNYDFIISDLTNDVCIIHEEFTMLSIMDSRNWTIAISFEGADKGEFKINSTYTEPNIVTVNVGQEDYMSSLENGVLTVTEFTEDNWISGNFSGVTGTNKDINISGSFTVQAKRF